MSALPVGVRMRKTLVGAGVVLLGIVLVLVAARQQESRKPQTLDLPALLAATANAAAVDYFLKIDGIPGESRDEAHRGEIELDSFSWGQTQAGVQRSGEGKGAGNVRFQDFHFVMKVSAASPKLFLTCASGDPITNAILTVRKAGREPADYLQWTFEDLLCTSYQTGGSSGNEPTEQISINVGKIQVAYKVQTEAGGGTIQAGWDVKKNQAF